MASIQSACVREVVENLSLCRAVKKRGDKVQVSLPKELRTQFLIKIMIAVSRS